MKFYKQNYYRLIFGVIVLFANFQAHASNQVSSVPPPDGTVSIIITKADTAQITGLSDMSIPLNTTTSSGITWVSDVCVYSSFGSPNYTIKAIGSSSADGAFIVADGKNLLPYNVVWSVGGNGNLSSTDMSLIANVPSNTISKTATNNYNCNGTANGNTASLIINIPQETLQTANADGYADSLTLVIAPN